MIVAKNGHKVSTHWCFASLLKDLLTYFIKQHENNQYSQNHDRWFKRQISISVFSFMSTFWCDNKEEFYLNWTTSQDNENTPYLFDTNHPPRLGSLLLKSIYYAPKQRENNIKAKARETRSMTWFIKTQFICTLDRESFDVVTINLDICLACSYKDTSTSNTYNMISTQVVLSCRKVDLPLLLLKGLQTWNKIQTEFHLYNKFATARREDSELKAGSEVYKQGNWKDVKQMLIYDGFNVCNNVLFESILPLEGSRAKIRLQKSYNFVWARWFCEISCQNSSGRLPPCHSRLHIFTYPLSYCQLPL